MPGMFKLIRRFFTDEDAPASVEYAVMIALIAVVVIVGAQALGVNIRQVIVNVAKDIDTLVLQKIKGKGNAAGGGDGIGTDPGMDPGG